VDQFPVAGVDQIPVAEIITGVANSWGAYKTGESTLAVPNR
jgi:hypothetical protein